MHNKTDVNLLNLQSLYCKELFIKNRKKENTISDLVVIAYEGSRRKVCNKFVSCLLCLICDNVFDIKTLCHFKVLLKYFA